MTLRADRMNRLREVLAGHAAGGGVGLTWALDRGGETLVDAVGTTEPGGSDPVRRDTIFRISSMTKPVTAVAALVLVEECRLRLDDPVDDLLPELADRRVLADPAGPLTETVPAVRPITVRDLLTFRLGLGMDFAASHPQPVLAAMAELGVGAGPPAPGHLPPPDEWIARLGTLPLAHQPGERWLYHTGAEVLGVLVSRAAGQPLEAFMQERIFDPLGMRDTGFSVPPASLDRFGACYGMDPTDPYDPRDGQWATPPAFANGGDGLVSTIDDFLAFARMLRARGAYDGGRLLARPTVETMTTNQIGDVTGAGPDPSGASGWGFGLRVQLVRADPSRPVGSYGWDGGLGSSWANDPAEGLIGIIMTNQMWTSPSPPAVCRDFWTSAYAAIDD